MAGVYKLEIQESEDDLKALVRSQRNASDKDRVQMLYLLKSKRAKTLQQAAQLLGRHRITIQTWARAYRQGGLAQLLSHKPHLGVASTLPDWAEAKLKARLEAPEGFENYEEIRQWLATHLGIEAPYKTVHKWVFYRLKAAPKSSRAHARRRSSGA